ncbi:hypothetical protein D3C80_1981550 [compost metagenome]
MADDGAATPDIDPAVRFDPPFGSDADRRSGAVYRQPGMELTGDKVKFLHKHIAERGEAR